MSILMMLRLAAPASLFAILTATPAHADPVAGQALFNKACAACHSAEKGADHRQGPNLWGVFGSKAAGKASYSYSPSLAGAPVIWNEESLNRWLEAPEEMVPGSRMGYAMHNEERRKLILDYLKTLNDPGSPANSELATAK